MKKFLLLCFAALFSSTVFAQNADLQDVVHLKNGSIVRGTIIEQVPGESLKIETRDGNVFVYKMDEIDKMTREKSAASFGMRPKFEAKPKGYAGFIETGYGFGVGKDPMLGSFVNRYELDIINGYQINPYCFVGLGVGFNLFLGHLAEDFDEDISDKDVISLPIFAHTRFNFIDRDVSPFIALNIGYNISTKKKEQIGSNAEYALQGGLIFEPSLGVAIRTSNKNSVTVGIGYSLMEMRAKLRHGKNVMDDEKFSTQAIRLKIGVTF